VVCVFEPNYTASFERSLTQFLLARLATRAGNPFSDAAYTLANSAPDAAYTLSHTSADLSNSAPYATNRLVGVASKRAAHTLYTLHALLHNLAGSATKSMRRLSSGTKKMLKRAPYRCK
jgi:hypothetical protein